MRYELIPHVRMYKDKRLAAVGWEGRTVYWHLRLEADDFGRVEVEPTMEAEDVAGQLDISPLVLTEGLPRLLMADLVRWESPGGIKETPEFLCSLGVSVREGGALRVVDFVASETAKMSTSVRLWRLRHKRRALKRETQKLQRTPRVSKQTYTPEKVSAEVAREQGLITRTRAAEIMGCSLATLRRREGSIVRPLVTDLGEHVFREDDVKAAALKLIMKPHASRPRSERSEDPIWRDRAARLLEQMGSGEYSASELAVLCRRAGIKETVVGDLLAAADGVEIQKKDGKFSAIVPVKGEKL